jgi:rhodanese-related sulfurtransferase
MDRRTGALSARSWFGLAAISVITFGLIVVGAPCGGGDDDSDDGSPAGGTVGQNIPVAGGGSYTQVTPAELQTMLQAKDFPLINVHIPYEGEIAGTDSHIPFDQIMQRLNELPPDKNAKVVIYCRSGNMSTQAAQELVQAGYTNLWELGGGMVAWEAAGLSLVTEG